MFNSIITVKALLVLLLSAVLITALPATAQTTTQAITLTTNIVQNEEDDWDDDWQEVEQSPYQILGFIEAAKGQFTQNNRVNNASSMSEFRARIEFNYSHDLFEITAKGDASYDDVLDENQWQTREVNLSASPLDILDVKIGRQILTWGTGDYLFLNDLFAKDWQSFFAGRDDEYLKAPSDSIKTSWYFEKFSFDLAWTPEFTPDNYLTGERFAFYSPESQSIIAPANNFKIEQTKNAQWATRIATTHNSVEYALYGYKGYWTTPQGINSDNTSYFPKLNSWGASVRMPLGKGLFNSEYVYYQSAENKKGKLNNIAHSQSRFLMGYEQELMKHLTFSFQYYVEKTHDYKKLTYQQTTAPIIDEYRQLLTTRFTYSAMQQKLIYSLFSFFSPTDQDAYIRPSVQFRQNDQWSFAIGANLFKGKNNYSFFGQHQDNSNAWARIRFQF